MLYRKHPYISFFIWPFGALLLNILNIRASYFKNLLWMFIIFYGYTFVLNSEERDADRYKNKLIEFYEQKDLSLEDIFGEVYTENYTDILQPTVTYIISRFTNDPQILFALFGFIFGYFYSRNIALILELIPTKLNKHETLFLTLLAFLIPIWQINGFRMWTAAHIFIFFFLKFLKHNNKKYLFGTFLTFFVHFSFIFPIVIMSIYMLLGNRTNLYFVFFLITFFVSEVSINFSKIVPDLPLVFQDRIESYTNQDYIDFASSKQVQVNWYIMYRGRIIRYLLYSLLVFLYLIRSRFFKNKQVVWNLISFTFLFASVSNLLLAQPVASLGRFIAISNLLVCITLLLLFEYLPKKMVRIASPIIFSIISFYLIIEIRIGFDTMGTSTIALNPFIAPFINENIPLIDFFK